MNPSQEDVGVAGATPEIVAHQLLAENSSALLIAKDYSLFPLLARRYISADPEVGAPPQTAGRTELVALGLDALLKLVVTTLAPSDPDAAARAIDVYVADVVPALWAAGRGSGPIMPLINAAKLEGKVSGATQRRLQGVDPQKPPSAALTSIAATKAARQALEASRGATPSASAADTAPLAADPSAAAMYTDGGEQAKAAENASSPSQPEAETEADAKTGDEAGEDQASTNRSASAQDSASAAPPPQAVSYDEIRERCLRARKEGRKVIAVVGLAATGKSFLVDRLKLTLEQKYDFEYLHGAGDTVARDAKKKIERTRAVLLTRFSRADNPRSRQNFDLYDIPGDQFVSLVRSNWRATEGNRSLVKLIYAIMTFADGIVFIAPAMQVLRRAAFLAQGDDQGLTQAERENRATDIDLFIQGLAPMMTVISLLRRRYKERYRALKTSSRAGASGAVTVPAAPRRRLLGSLVAKPDASSPSTRPSEDLLREQAADQAINSVLEMSYKQISDERRNATRLPIAAILLLSRADELRKRLGVLLNGAPRANAELAQAGFDFDPALQLLSRGREHLDKLSTRFDAFSVDFLTSEDEHEPESIDFNPANPSYGAAGLIEKWMLPTIGSVRRARLRPDRWLRSPSLALRLRRWLDPRFESAWNGKTIHD